MPWPVKNGEYIIVPQYPDKNLYAVIKKDSTGYTVNIDPNWKGVRCSCPPVKFHKKTDCKHQQMVHQALQDLGIPSLSVGTVQGKVQKALAEKVEPPKNEIPAPVVKTESDSPKADVPDDLKDMGF